MSKRAIILAGGKGTRLRPYTVVLPKPLMPIGDYSILEVVIRQLTEYNFKHITIAVNHQAEIIKAVFGDGSKWNIKIDYSFERDPLGTMGPLRIIPDLPENFLVMNGDILTNLNYSKFFEDHVANKDIFTISAHTRMHRVDYGVLKTEKNSDFLLEIKEKPIHKYKVSMGIYMINQDALKFIPNNKYFGFDDLMIEMLNKQKKIKVNTFEGYWLDIGRPDDYAKAIDEFEGMKERILNG